MPHQRKRLIQPLILKKLKLWPAIGIVGLRQSGKSTLLREQISKEIDLEYITLDTASQRQRAELSPESFVEMRNKTLAIDEVQKVPDLFDAIKSQIDSTRRPGKYILSGSTAFSEKTGIRESLTGRIQTLHMHPFCLAEIHQCNPPPFLGKKAKCQARYTIKDFEKKITNGGMPGFFYLHSKDDFSQAAQGWIETTCLRDLSKVMRKSFDGDLALRIYQALADLDEPTATELAFKLKKDRRIIQKYLDAFALIFALIKKDPHPAGVGKSRYLYPDSGIANFLGASEEAQLESHVAIELLVQFEALGWGRPLVSYYKTEKRSYVPFILEWTGKKEILSVQIFNGEKLPLGIPASLKSFKNKFNSKRPLRSLILTQTLESYFEKDYEVYSLRS